MGVGEIISLDDEVYTLYDLLDIDHYDIFKALKAKYDACLVSFSDNYDEFYVECSGEFKKLESAIIAYINKRYEEHDYYIDYELAERIVVDVAKFIASKMSIRETSIDIFSVNAYKQAYIIVYK